MDRRRRWYGFLYTVLGAQGSFFAWVVSLFGIYVTFNEALLWVVNPSPVRTTAGEVFREPPKWRRWVRVGGVEIDLASALFAARGTGPGSDSTVRADRILIDRDDPAALAWRETFREIETVRGELEGEASDAADARLKRLQGVLFRIGAEATRRLYIPEHALVVIARDQPALGPRVGADPPPGSGASLADRWRHELRERIDLIRAAVRIDVEREGILEPLPERRRQSYVDAYGVSVAGAALGVGHRPSTVFAALFGAFAVTLAFLVAGLRAAGG